MTMLAVGDPAPDFTAPSQHERTVTLSAFRGSKVAVYFYPKDNTVGCTKQACNLRDHMAALAAQGITVIGISGDTVASHQRFAVKYDLPFLLVADPERSILEAYGVWGEKRMFGRTYLGIRRTTFLVDEQGIIRHIIRRPKVIDHAAEIMKAFEA